MSSTTSSSALIAIPLLLAIALRSQTLQPFEAVEPHMGTLFRIKLYAPDESTAQSAFRAAFDRIADLDRTLSDYDPQSELSRLSSSKPGVPVPLGHDLWNVLAFSQRLSEQTGGAFDVTLGPLTRVWRAGRKAKQIPDPELLEAASSRCGYRKLVLDSQTRSATLATAGMQLDAGGIAKGYAADEALARLKSLGIHSALVAASGDLAFSDAPPGKRGWTVGVDSLDDAHKPFTVVLLLANGAISTSGDTEQFLDANGVRYSHIIDPRTHSGLTRPLTVTVYAPTGMEADSLATALNVMGPDRGLPFVEAHSRAAAIFVFNSPNGLSRESSQFRQLPRAR